MLVLRGKRTTKTLRAGGVWCRRRRCCVPPLVQGNLRKDKTKDKGNTTRYSLNKKKGKSSKQQQQQQRVETETNKQHKWEGNLSLSSNQTTPATTTDTDNATSIVFATLPSFPLSLTLALPSPDVLSQSLRRYLLLLFLFRTPHNPTR